MAKIKDLEDMATAVNVQCRTLDMALKDKIGIAYEVVVQWRINKFLKRIRNHEVLDGPERPAGGDPSRAPKRTSRAKLAPGKSLHLPGLAPNGGTSMDTRGSSSTPPTDAE